MLLSIEESSIRNRLSLKAIKCSSTVRRRVQVWLEFTKRKTCPNKWSSCISSIHVKLPVLIKNFHELHGSALFCDDDMSG